MSKYILKKILFFCSFFLVIAAVNIYPQSTLQKSIDDVLQDSFFSSSIAAIDVYDLGNNVSLYRKNERLLLRPASTMKIFTSYSALYFLTDKYNFTTSVYYSGEIEDSICYGDIYIVGGFDPNLSTDDIDSLSRKIKEYGIKEIRGSLIADVSNIDSLYWGEGWMWDDDPYDYNPYLSSLTVDKGTFALVIEPDRLSNKVKTSVFPKMDFFEVHNAAVLSTSDTTDLKIARLNNKNIFTLSGVVAPNRKTDTMRVILKWPEMYFLRLMKNSLKKYNIKLHGNIAVDTTPENSKEILAYKNDIVSVLSKMNKDSDNLNAELVLRALAYNLYGKPASAKKGIKLIDSLITLTGFNPKDYRIADGSGLSFYNLISAELLTEVLKFIYKSDSTRFNIFYNTLPIYRVDGTLEKRLNYPELTDNVHAKTGTLSGTSNLAGYITTKKNNFVAFTVLLQNFTGSAGQARRLQDLLCRTIYEHY